MLDAVREWSHVPCAKQCCKACKVCEARQWRSKACKLCKAKQCCKSCKVSRSSVTLQVLARRSDSSSSIRGAAPWGMQHNVLNQTEINLLVWSNIDGGVYEMVTLAKGNSERDPIRGSGRAAVSMTSISDFKATKIDGTEIDLSSFKGKPTLVMNVASL